MAAPIVESSPSSEPNELPPSFRSQVFRSTWVTLLLYNVAWGFLFQQRALYLRDPAVGLTWQQMGWIGFLRACIFGVMPIVLGTIADRLAKNRGFMLAGFAIAGIGSSLFLFAHNFWQIAALTAADTLGTTAYTVSLNSLASLTLTENARGRQFGQHRIGGSIGWGLSAFLLVPILARDTTYAASFYAGTFVYLLCFAVTYGWVKDPPKAAKQASAKGSWKKILRHRPLMTLYLCQAFGSIGGSMCFQFFPNHLKETYGLGNDWVGIMLGLQVLAEIPSLILLGWLSDRWGRKPILVLAFFSSGIRWMLIGWAPSAGWIAPVQMLWGLGFSGYTVGVALMTELVEPENRGSAFGLLNLSYGVGNLLGPPLGGYIADHFGLPMVYRLGGSYGILAGIALAFLLNIRAVPEAKRAEANA